MRQIWVRVGMAVLIVLAIMIAMSSERKPKLRVLDAQTRKPVANCCFCLGHWGTWKWTDEKGIFDKDEDNFAIRLGGEELELWHPDYESKFFERQADGSIAYARGLTGTVTVLLEKSGTSAVDVNVALIVRGKKVDNESCTIRILRGEKPEGFEVRKAIHPPQKHCRFSGLAAGKYVAQVYFYDAHYQTFELAEGEQKSLQINVMTDELATILLKGRIRNKFTGNGIAGAFLGSIPDKAVKTQTDGLFSTAENRASFHETVIYLDYAHQHYVLARMNNHISEALAQKLEFHIDPNNARTTHSFLEDKNGDGIFCDKVNCKICDDTQNGAVAEANSVGAEKRN